MNPAVSNLEIHDGLRPELIEDALRMSYEAFSRKFSIGFRGHHDYVRLFRDQVNHRNCITATVDGRLAGILTIQTNSQDFYGFSICDAFVRFNPIRVLRIMFNIAIFALEERPKDNEFVVDTLVVDTQYRGMGIGTELMAHAEKSAAAMGKGRMTLNVIHENEGAMRLYERIGYRKISTHTGIAGCRFKHLFGTRAVHKMQKPVERAVGSD